MWHNFKIQDIQCSGDQGFDLFNIKNVTKEILTRDFSFLRSEIIKIKSLSLLYKNIFQFYVEIEYISLEG